MSAAVVIAERVSKRFVLQTNRALTVKQRVIDTLLRRSSGPPATLDAVREVSFSVDHGESVALVGRNGSGKSTLLKLIAGIHHSSGGRLLVRAGLKMATMIELGVGFHPELTGRENVYLNAAIHGRSRAEIDAIYPSVVAYSELERFIDTPIKTYSSGMIMRLGFAAGVSLDPEVFLLDEIFAVGDEGFQKKCLATMKKFRAEGRTMFFVSHSAGSVREMCTRALVLDGGQLVFDGGTEPGIQRYRRILGEEASRAAIDAQTAAGTSGAPAQDRQDGWHRRRIGGATWDSAGEQHFAFLRQHGLSSGNRVLDLGCGALRTGTHLLRFLEPGRYVGVDADAALIAAGINVEAPRAGVDPNRGAYLVTSVTDLSSVEGPFDVIFCTGLLEELAYESVARMFAASIPRLAADGRMFVAFFEAPGAVTLDPIEHPGPAYSTFDGPGRHYDFGTLARIADACGGRAERLGEWGDPHGQSMLVIVRNSG